MTHSSREARRTTPAASHSGVRAAAVQNAARGALLQVRYCPDRCTGGTPEPPRRRGHTLIELTTSMAITAVVMGGMMSVLVVASRAVNLDTGRGARSAEAALATHRIAADLNHLRNIVNLTPQRVTAVVPDRSGNGATETVSYAWSGTPGDPLTYAYNGNTPAPLLTAVDQLLIQVLTRELVPLASVESSEVLLLSHDDIVLGGKLEDYRLSSDNWCAQYLRPKMPRNVISWKLTRIRMRMRRQGPSSTLALEVRAADIFQKPTNVVLHGGSVSSASVPSSMSWVDFDFNSPVDLNPLNGACLVVRQESAHAASSAQIQYQDAGTVMPRNTHWMTSSNGGSPWTQPGNSADMRFYAYGTYITRGPPQ